MGKPVGDGAGGVDGDRAVSRKIGRLFFVWVLGRRKNSGRAREHPAAVMRPRRFLRASYLTTTGPKVWLDVSGLRRLTSAPDCHGLQCTCHGLLRQPRHSVVSGHLASTAGFEPAAMEVEAPCSIRLSYVEKLLGCGWLSSSVIGRREVTPRLFGSGRIERPPPAPLAGVLALHHNPAGLPIT